MGKPKACESFFSKKVKNFVKKNDFNKFYANFLLPFPSFRPTNDIYKIHCIVQVDLPERWNDFGQRLHQYLMDYKRFGQEFSADADSSFYFRRVRGKFIGNTIAF